MSNYRWASLDVLDDIVHVEHGTSNGATPSLPTSNHSNHCLYVFELDKVTLTTEAPDNLTGLLSSHFGIKQSVFRRHAQPGTKLSYNEDIVIPRMISRVQKAGSNSFLTKYFDCRTYRGDPAQLPLLRPDMGRDRLLCSATGRQIGIHEWQGRSRNMLFVVPRKCTYWTKQSENGSRISMLGLTS
jgi:hypothetical protein